MRESSSKTVFRSTTQIPTYSRRVHQPAQTHPVHACHGEQDFTRLPRMTGESLKFFQAATVVEVFPSNDRATDCCNLDLSETTKHIQRPLGVHWDLKSDTLSFKTSIRRSKAIYKTRSVVSRQQPIRSPGDSGACSNQRENAPSANDFTLKK